MKRALTTLRRLHREGRHLHFCFVTQAEREAGWKLMQTARRACRRLGWRPEAVL